MSEIQVFTSRDFTVRTVTDADGTVWFVGKDIAEALEYSEDSNPSRLFANVPDVWKGVKRIHTPGGEQEMLCLTEQGVYFFLGRSDKPKALPYQMWIAGEVVPTLRNTGSYSLASQPVEEPATPKLPEHSGVIKAAERIVHKAFNCKAEPDYQEVLALDKVFKQTFGVSVLELAGLRLVRKTQRVRYRIEMSIGYDYDYREEEVFSWEHNYPMLSDE